MEDEKPKKKWGASHWIATVATIAATGLGSNHMIRSNEATFSLEEKIALLEDVKEISRHVNNIEIRLQYLKLDTHTLKNFFLDKRLVCTDPSIKIKKGS